MIASVLLTLAFLSPVALQSADPCQAGTPPYVVTSGGPYKILATVPSVVLDTVGNQMVNTPKGFKVALDGGSFIDVGLPTLGALCPAGSPRVGEYPVTIPMASGVARGPHNVHVRVYYDSLDAAGQPIIMESAAVTIPFVAVDPVRSVALPISSGRVIR